MQFRISNNMLIDKFDAVSGSDHSKLLTLEGLLYCHVHVQYQLFSL